MREAVLLLRTTLTTVKDADENLRNALGYPLEDTLASQPAQEFLKGGLIDIVREILTVRAASSVKHA